MKEGNEVIKELIELDKIWKELDELYHNFAKHCGLSDSAFWLIYTIYESDSPYIQTDLYNMWSYSKQTVNSTLKVLIEKNIIKFEITEENRKNKLIKLTEIGEKLAEDMILPLMNAESAAFGRLSGRERSELIKILSKHVRLLKEETGKVLF